MSINLSNTLPQNIQSAPRKKIDHFSYLLNQTIGKGYSSSVYKGKNQLTNDNVAIKVIDMKMLKNQIHQVLLASQIQCLKKLKRSPYIIDLIEVYTTKNNTYLISELCQGGDLSNVISKKKLPEKQAIFYMQQILQGYLQIYKKGIIHRDLKPANILLKSNKNIKIADFGFSIKLQDNKKNSSYNVGSPLYMPPQTLLENKYSFKSDIWALGVIFFQMITSRTPWKARTEKQLAQKIMNSKIKEQFSILQISPVSIQFLSKTLNPNFYMRIGPEQLQNFSFCQPLRRTPTQIKCDNSMLKSQKKVYNQDKSRHKPTNSTLPSIHNEMENQKTMKKQSSKNILSYVHLCRFLYKLIMRIEGVNIENTSKLRQQLTSLIYYKLNLLNKLEKINIFQIENYNQFKQTADFKKIIGVVKQYDTRYRQLLAKYKFGKPFQQYKCIYKQLIQLIKKLHSKVEYITEQQVQNLDQQITLLDYLVTAYQLINLDAIKDIKQFSKKSKIQIIVEGATSNVTYAHLKAIKDKVYVLKLN